MSQASFSIIQMTCFHQIQIAMTEIIKLGNQQGVAKHKRCLELGPFCKVVFALSTCMMALTLKGSFTIFLFLVRSHILNSNGVWYWWFCPEGPINAPNSRFLGFYFVPWDLDSQRHMGPRLAAQGTLTRSAGDLDYILSTFMYFDVLRRRLTICLLHLV